MYYWKTAAINSARIYSEIKEENSIICIQEYKNNVYRYFRFISSTFHTDLDKFESGIFVF